jgi:hypothetical protein
MSSEITIRAPEFSDPITDKCSPVFTNDRAAAILEINGLVIPLSLERINKLISEVIEFKNIIFCYKCNNFIMSKSGWNYGGSCKLAAERNGKILTEKDAGFYYCTDCTNTCPDAIPKKGVIDHE